MYVKTEPTDMVDGVMSTNKCYDIHENNINNPVTKRCLVNESSNISNNIVSMNEVNIKTEPPDTNDEVMSMNKSNDVHGSILNKPICTNEFIVKSEFVTLNQEPDSSECNNIETVFIKQEKMDEEMFNEEKQNELLVGYSVDINKIKCENEPVDINSASSTSENLNQMIDIKPQVARHLNVNNVLTESRDTREPHCISSTDDMSQYNYNSNIIITEEIDIKTECVDDGEYEESAAVQDTASDKSSSESDESSESLAINKRKKPTATRSSHLIAHKRVHSEEKPFKCDQCNNSYLASGSLTTHKRQHTGEKPFKCNQCDKAFASSSSLNIHKRKHSGEKPFKCEQCDMAFSRSSILIRHKNIHSGEKPFKCEQCGKAFLRSSHLIYHKRVHSGEKPYKCDQCYKEFSQSSHLISHKRVHSGEKPFKCDQCDKEFSQSASLIRHKRLHSEEKPI